MVQTTINGFEITGIAAAVSDSYFSIEDAKNDSNRENLEKFEKMTGIKGSYRANPKQTTSDFCYVAARELLKYKKVAPEEIGALILVTQSEDYHVPATACVLQSRLGLSKDILAFDINLGCSGYVYGLGTIMSLLSTSNIDKALLLVGDTVAKTKKVDGNANETNTYKFLFGDSGTATLIERSEKAAPIVSLYRTDGSQFKAIVRPYGHWRHPNKPDVPEMDDIGVFNFTMSEVPELIKDYFELTGTTIDDYDGFVPHQANQYILKQLARKTKIPFDKVLLSIDKYANTSSSSIPLTIAHKFGEEDSDREIRFLVCGFGVGLSWAISDIRVNVNNVLPVITTDEYYDDGYVD